MSAVSQDKATQILATWLGWAASWLLLGIALAIKESSAAFPHPLLESWREANSWLGLPEEGEATLLRSLLYSGALLLALAGWCYPKGWWRRAARTSCLIFGGFLLSHQLWLLAGTDGLGEHWPLLQAASRLGVFAALFFLLGGHSVTSIAKGVLFAIGLVFFLMGAQSLQVLPRDVDEALYLLQTRFGPHMVEAYAVSLLKVWGTLFILLGALVLVGPHQRLLTVMVVLGIAAAGHQHFIYESAYLSQFLLRSPDWMMPLALLLLQRKPQNDRQSELHKLIRMRRGSRQLS